MPELALDLASFARLRALRDGRAAHRTATRQVGLPSHARALVLLPLAGEESRLHAVIWGPVGGPHVLAQAVVDPRERDDELVLVDRLLRTIERYLRWCLRQGLWPQVWVSSEAAATHLDLWAERVRYAGSDEHMKALGEIISYLPLRRTVVGQQALAVATEVLARHWATGQTPAEDQHLGALLAWIDPLPGVDVPAAALKAARSPMGPHTPPSWDIERLAPLLERYHRDRKRGAGRWAREWGRQVREEVLALAEPIYANIGRAHATLRGLTLPELPDVAQLGERETREFARFMQSRVDGYHLPLHDTPRQAAITLLLREDAAEQWEAAVTTQDQLAFEQAVLDGRVITGTVEYVLPSMVGRSRRYRSLIRSPQAVLAFRPGAELRYLVDPRLRGRVLSIDLHDDGVTFVEIEFHRGQIAVPVPRPGAPIVLVGRTPEWNRQALLLRHLRSSLQVVPWTHADGPPAMPGAAKRSRQNGDPLKKLRSIAAAVEMAD